MPRPLPVLWNNTSRLFPESTGPGLMVPGPFHKKNTMTIEVANLSSELLTELTGDADLSFPEVNVSDAAHEFPAGLLASLQVVPVPPTNDSLTTGKVTGDGTFDVLMAGVASQLLVEYRAGRITGAEYTKAYAALTQSAMQSAVQFLASRDQSYWQSVASQVQALTARMQLETARVQLALVEYEARTAKINYAIGKIKLAGEAQAYETAKVQTELIRAQVEQTAAQTAQAQAQTAQLEVQTKTAQYQLDQILPQQKALVAEQIEAQRAQTLNTRTDGTPISGTLGSQKDLYNQQIDSYKRDSEYKVGKLFSDLWVTMRSTNEDVEPPVAATNANISTLLTKLRTNNNLGTTA